MRNELSYNIELDDLAVGLTRPAMVFGVTLTVAFLNLVLCSLAYVYTQTLYVIPIFAILHLVAIRISMKEPRFLEIYMRWINRTPPLLNYRFWGNCNSYLPE